MKEELNVKVRKKAIDEEGGESESDYVQMSWKRNDERFGRCSERNCVGDLN